MEDTRFRFLAGRLPADAVCNENRVLLTRYLGRGLSSENEARFRAHLTECKACCDVYRAALKSAASVGNALRTSRKERERSARKAAARKSVLAAGSVSTRAKRFRLQAILLPAFLIVLLMQWGVFGKETLNVVDASGSGTLHVSGELVVGDDVERELLTGHVCRTAGAMSATVEGFGTRLVLGNDTEVLVEDDETARFRLVTGEVEFTGSPTLSTVFGVLTGSGEGRLSLRQGVFELFCIEGELSFTDPLGERSLRGGERLMDPRGGRTLVSR